MNAIKGTDGTLIKDATLTWPSSYFLQIPRFYLVTDLFAQGKGT